MPTAYKQKKEVRALVEALRRPKLQADQNIEEALAAVNTALNTPTPRSGVAALLAEARTKLSALVAEGQQATAEGDAAGATLQANATAARKAQLAFWLMAAATERFVANEGSGQLPLIGSIPDMTADTDTYVVLQQLYSQQAAADVAGPVEGAGASLSSRRACHRGGGQGAAASCVTAAS